MSPASTPPPILLVEPSSLTASIIVSTARQLNLPMVRQVSSVRTAQQHLAAQGFLGVIVSLDEAQAAVALLDTIAPQHQLACPRVRRPRNGWQAASALALAGACSGARQPAVSWLRRG